MVCLSQCLSLTLPSLAKRTILFKAAETTSFFKNPAQNRENSSRQQNRRTPNRMSGKVLFACSKCFSRHLYEELSSGQQLCKVKSDPKTTKKNHRHFKQCKKKKRKK